MTNHVSVARGLDPPQWTTSIDIQDAYLHIPLRRSLHKFLAFIIDHRLFFFRALPFGLAEAPRLFTRILRWPLQRLHWQVINAVAYLDDLLIWADSKEAVTIDTTRKVEILRSLGLLLNLPKFRLMPKTSFTWLGIHWDTDAGVWGLPREKATVLSKNVWWAVWHLPAR